MSKPRKAQMFIVTMVFMAAMVFTIQGLLLSYSGEGLSAMPRTSDTYVIQNLETVFQRALDSSDSCLQSRHH
jgi:hypothetical protein